MKNKATLHVGGLTRTYVVHRPLAYTAGRARIRWCWLFMAEERQRAGWLIGRISIVLQTSIIFWSSIPLGISSSGVMDEVIRLRSEKEWMTLLLSRRFAHN